MPRALNVAESSVKFILTRELGRLSKWLRILGFDAEYYTSENTGSLFIEALRGNRIILTRNHRMPQSRGIRIATISAERLPGQLAEVMQVFGLRADTQAMFTRCIICNVALINSKKEEVKDKVPEYVWRTHDTFVACPHCRKIYWQGSHWGNVTQLLEKLQLQ